MRLKQLLDAVPGNHKRPSLPDFLLDQSRGFINDD